jgi:hypothetical protein
MNPITHILINPWFSKENRESFTLVYSGEDIDNCIKYFWSELSRRNMIIDEIYQMENFPMTIYDKQLEKIRTFLLSTGLYKQSMRLNYNEIPCRMSVDSFHGYDSYYNKLLGQCCVNLDLSNINMNQRQIMFPKFRRSLLLRY